ncbi:hypothetical protein ACLX1H_010513 [Fusarium chlamydosporum]
MPDNKIEADIELLDRNKRVIKWGLRFRHLIEEHETAPVMDQVTIWDYEVMNQMRSF